MRAYRSPNASFNQIATGFALLVSLCACGSPSPTVFGPQHDMPAAKDEPRAEMHLRLDLPMESACEERFDLALYENTAVELIQWEQGKGCAGRSVRIRYLPKRIRAGSLLEEVRAHATAAQELP